MTECYLHHYGVELKSSGYEETLSCQKHHRNVFSLFFSLQAVDKVKLKSKNPSTCQMSAEDSKDEFKTVFNLPKATRRVSIF